MISNSGRGLPEGGEKVAPDEPDSCDVEDGRVRPGEPQGPDGDVHGGDPGQGKLPGQSDRDVAAPGSDVQYGRPSSGGRLKGFFDHELGLGSGNEDSRSYFERQGPEFLPAGQVVQRMSGQPLLDETQKPSLDLSREAGPPVRNRSPSRRATPRGGGGPWLRAPDTGPP